MAKRAFFKWRFRGSRYLFTAVLIGVILAAAAFVFYGNADIKDTETSMQKTVKHIQNQCMSYEEVVAADKVKSLIRLTEQTEEISRDLETSYQQFGYDFLKEYTKEQRISGVILLDGALNEEYSYSKVDVGYHDLKHLFSDKVVTDILDYPAKIYAERLGIGGKYYDVAVLARLDKKGLVCCYRYQDYEIMVLSQVSIENLLDGYIVDRNGIIAVTNAYAVQGSNDKSLQGKPVSDVEWIQKINAAEPKNGFIKIEDNGRKYYAGKSKYRYNDIYICYPEQEVFQLRAKGVFYVVFIYTLLCLLFYIFRSKNEKKYLIALHSQLETIRAISMIYETNILLDLKEKTFEVIKASPGVTEEIQNTKWEHKKIRLSDAIEKVLTKHIDAEYRDLHHTFADLDTLGERLKSKDYVECIYKTTDNHWMREIIIPKERDKNNNVLSAVVVVRNISEQKETEFAYQERLKKTTAEAVRANQAKTEFLRRMSHDIRTPINAIFGMLEIGKAYPDDVKKQEYCRNKVADASALLLELVNDVLTMNKLDSGNFAAEEAPFTLPESVAEIYSVIEVLADEKEIHFKPEETVTQHPNLIGCKLCVKQILLNVLSNAVKYTKPGGTICVSCTETGVKDGASMVRFVCRDNGVGMSKAFQEHMFEPFAREEQHVSPDYDGIGLGLSIVKKMVDSMHGEIKVESEKGKGSCFTILLPIAIAQDENQVPSDRVKPAEAEEAASAGQPESALCGISILLAEDNPLNMEIAEFILTNAGASVVKAKDGEEAVKLWKKSAPGTFDVILMDLMMPRLNGIEATRAIRAAENPGSKRIPIIALTANTYETDVQECRNAGMNAHLAKPLHANNMVRVILETLGKNYQE